MNIIQIKRGAGVPPVYGTSSPNGLYPYELGFNTSDSLVYINNGQACVPVGCVPDTLKTDQSVTTDKVALIMTGTGVNVTGYIYAANKTQNGLLTNTTQTIGGAKTFSNDVNIEGALTVTGTGTFNDDVYYGDNWALMDYEASGQLSDVYLNSGTTTPSDNTLLMSRHAGGDGVTFGAEASTSGVVLSSGWDIKIEDADLQTSLVSVLGKKIIDGWTHPALCFTANEAGSTISMSVTGTPTLGQNFQYSTDNGDSWNTFVVGTTKITLAKGDRVWFKGNNPNGVSESDSIYYQFVMTGSISASGDIMSLIDDGACTTAEIPNEYCFCGMFRGCTSLTTAPSLPATTLADSCYYMMFSRCTSLTTAPSLPATTLAWLCYSSMFYGCISLTTAPSLPATILASWCYSSMFYGCTSLTTAPSLPATTLADSCYYSMFQGCTSLTTAPSLPATTLADYCYYMMFSGCTSLTTAPSLPATTLADSCYYSMFQGCTSLYVSGTSGSRYSKAWRVPTNGTFTNTYSQGYMFKNCKGTRSSNDMAGASGKSYTYYTQNTPV